MLVNREKRTKLAGVSMGALAVCMMVTSPVQADEVIAKAAALHKLPMQHSKQTVNGARPDISALRYYAIRGKQGRVQAEISRLKQLYPNWEQPENIFAEDNAQEQQLWKLYSRGDTEQVKAELVRLRTEDPSYSPSPELLDKLEQRETRTGIAGAWNRKDWDDVIHQANANPALLASGDIELIWFLAEAYAHKERPKDAYEAFGAALKSANSQQERKATIQKAALLLSTDQTLKLFHSTPELKGKTAIANEVHDAIVRGALARSAELGEQIPVSLQEHVESFITRASVNNSHEDSILLAWSKFGQRDWAGADEWFKRAMSQGESAKATEGAIMASMRLGKLDAAAQLAGQYLGASPEIGALFISVHAPALLQARPPKIDGHFLQTYAGKTIELENGEGSEALGWYAFNVDQLSAADAWFTKAMQWEMTETAVYGKTLTAVRRKDRSMFDALQREFGPKYPKVAALKYQTEVKRTKKRVTIKRLPAKVNKAGSLRKKIARLHQAKRFSRCLELSRGLRQYGPLRASDHQMRGWCLLGAKRPSEAERAFETAVRLGGKSKTPSAYGQALAALQSGKTNQALSIANSNRLTRRQRRVIDLELLTQRARAAFANKDYAATLHALNKRAKLKPETRDLTFLRGWSHYHSGRTSSARTVFANLDQQLSTRDSKRGLNAVNRLRTRAVSNDR